jgi:uncharacterized damage-inducible protein DinB
MLSALRDLQQHGEWADARLLDALRSAPDPVPEALRELSHVRGAQEVWLSRIVRRDAVLPVWPHLTLDELAAVGTVLEPQWRALLQGLDERRLTDVVSYRTTSGEAFATPLVEILLHVFTHGQYHRAKANAALKAAGTSPVGVDFIVWSRLPRS